MWHTANVQTVGSNQYKRNDSTAPASPQPAVSLLTQMSGNHIAADLELKPANGHSNQLKLAQNQKLYRSQLELAGDPATPAHILGQLAASPIPTVRAAVLANPSTSPQTLSQTYVRLGGHPFMDSPCAGSLLTNPSCPAWICADVLASRHISPGLWQIAGKHPNCPSALVEVTCAPPRGWDKVGSTWTQRDGFVCSTDRELSTFHWPPDTLRQLATHPNNDIRQAVSRNLYTPPETLTILTHDSIKQVVHGAAHNPNLPLEALATLARHRDEDIQTAVVKRPDCPAPILAHLLQSRHTRVVRMVIFHPTLPAAARAMWQLVHNSPEAT